MEELTNRKFLPYGHQSIDEEDIASVVEILRSDWVTQGPKIQQFEKAIARFVESKFAVAFSSGTAALHAACAATDLSPDDEAIISPITFVASSNCVLYLGAKPVFADIKKGTYNIDTNEIRKAITDKTKAIIPTDFAGQPVDLDEIKKIAEEFHLIIIEDAAHALGAEYKSKRIGGISDLTVFSFHPVKSITTGEGGMVTTNSKLYYEKLQIFRNSGITRNEKEFRKSNEGPWYYEMQNLGYNYRITDFQCALGLSQLRRIGAFIKRRRRIVTQYQAAFAPMNEVTLPYEAPNVKSAWHIYVIRLKLQYLMASRREIFEALRGENIGVQVHYIPVYYHPYYQNLGYKRGLCSKAEEYYEEAITLPIFPKMSDSDVESVINGVLKVLSEYKRKRS